MSSAQRMAKQSACAQSIPSLNEACGPRFAGLRRSWIRVSSNAASCAIAALSSLDALSASLNEANRWLKDQRELFAGLDGLTDEPPPEDLLRPRAGTKHRRERVAE